MRAALAIAVGSLIACGGGAAAPKPKAAVGPPVDAKEAKRGAAGLVDEIYDSLGRGNTDGLYTLLDPELIAFGPRKTDLLARADALIALGEIVDRRTKKGAVKPGKREVVAAPGGRSAWVFDLASVHGEPVPVIAVLDNADDLWLVSAIAIARAPAAPQLKAELAKDAVVPYGGAGKKQIAPDAKLAVEKFERGLLDQAVWGDDLTSRPDAIVVGPARGEVARGKAIKALWGKRTDAKTRAAVSGEITAGVTTDGQLAWVSAPLTRVEGDGDPLPLRAFAVFEKAGAAWTLIALHEGVAIAEPGAGAPFKKIVPPKPAEPKPPEIVEEKPAKPAAKKPVKKKPARKKKQPAAAIKAERDEVEEAPKQAPKKQRAKLTDRDKPRKDDSVKVIDDDDE